jgi:hypothetical protein
MSTQTSDSACWSSTKQTPLSSNQNIAEKMLNWCFITNTNYIVFGLTGPELALTISSTRVEHVNHYITDTVVMTQGYLSVIATF